MQAKPAVPNPNSHSARVEFASTTVCTFTEYLSSDAYVMYSGNIAGISDAPTSKADTESLDRSANEIKFNRQGIDSV